MGWDGQCGCLVLWVGGEGGGLLLCIYIYIIYTPNLGLGIAVSVREREQGRFRGSTEGARGSNEGARGSSERARGSTTGQYQGAAGGSLIWLPLARLKLLVLGVTSFNRIA